MARKLTTRIGSYSSPKISSRLAILGLVIVGLVIASHAHSQPVPQASAVHLCTQLGVYPGQTASATNVEADALSSTSLDSCVWYGRRSLRVRFLDGSPVVRRRVSEKAEQWSRHANMRFEWVEQGDADIRISFTRPGSWSFVGTCGRPTDQSQPTMNFGWINEHTPDGEVSRVVLHEFGHALGLEHEHQHPLANIPWNREAVYRYYAGQGWSREQVDRNVLRNQSPSGRTFTNFDPNSIMLYWFPAELTLDGSSMPGNSQLSSLDIELIRQIYPSPAPGSFEKSGNNNSVSCREFCENRRNNGIHVDWGRLGRCVGARLNDGPGRVDCNGGPQGIRDVTCFCRPDPVGPPCPAGAVEKPGNNNSVSCNEYCANQRNNGSRTNWGPLGRCVGARLNDGYETIGCGGGPPGIRDVTCFCDSGVPAGTFQKHGNNNSVSCNEFCANRRRDGRVINWGPVGQCVGARINEEGGYFIGCGGGPPGIHDVTCFCRG